MTNTDTIEQLKQKYTTDKFILKALEEMAELSEVLIKTLSKADHLKPPLEKIIEESGDVLYRITALCYKLNIGKEVEDRISEKDKQIKEWLKQ